MPKGVPEGCRPPYSCFTCPFEDCKRYDNRPTKAETAWIGKSGISALAISQHLRGILSFQIKLEISRGKVHATQNRWRKRVRKMELCQSCGVNPVIPGMTICEECREKMKKSRKERDAYRAEHHLCRDCGNPIDGKSKSLCNRCLAKKRFAAAKKRARLRAKQMKKNP